MTGSPTISVAIATMDRPDALARCVSAVLNGESRPVEVLVVDQGRRSAAPALEPLRGSVPLRRVRQRRRGLAASRNLAVALASGSVLAVTDDDCVPDAKWLAVLEEAFSDPSPPAAVTGRVLPYGPARRGTFAVSSRTRTTVKDFVEPAAPWLVGTGANFAVSTDLVRCTGAYDERLGAGSPGRAGEDIDLVYRLLRAGARVRYDPAAIVYHERQPRSRRLRTRTTYGYGVGAFCGIWARRGDPWAWRMLDGWLHDHAVAIRQALIVGDWRTTLERSLMVEGTLRGTLYGWRVEGRRGRSSARRPAMLA